MSKYVAGFGDNASPNPETLKSQGNPWMSRIPHRCCQWPQQMYFGHTDQLTIPRKANIHLAGFP